MQLSKNKKYQYAFFSILSIYIIFNGGNSNLFIQLNFILISLFFFYCLKDKNYQSHLNIFFIKNNFSIFFYFLFIIYLLFQIIPLPLNILKFFSPEKFLFIEILSNETTNSPISFAPTESFFQVLNLISLFVIVLITKMIIYSEKHKIRFYLFLSFLGFLSSLFAILLFLNGNPDFLFLKKEYYKNASTGFFINRTVFAVFLLFSLISSLELLKGFNKNKIKLRNDNFFLKIYIRLFLIFITIGIITSYSRIGNFLLLITIFFYFSDELFFKKNTNKSFLAIILLLIVFDILILGFYFGASQVIDRFYFLNEELQVSDQTNKYISRLEIIKFSYQQLNNFLFFGYGSGSYETIFQLKFINPDNIFANHSHSDLIEFIGEFGIIGISLLILSLFKFFAIMKKYNLINLILFSYLFIILLFDFSFHIPVIQVLFVIFFSIKSNRTTQIN